MRILHDPPAARRDGELPLVFVLSCSPSALGHGAGLHPERQFVCMFHVSPLAFLLFKVNYKGCEISGRLRARGGVGCKAVRKPN